VSSERTLVLKLVADVDKAARGVDKIEGRLGGMGKAVGALAGLAIIDKAAGAVIDFGKSALEAASSIEESNARLDTVLGTSARKVQAFAATSADAYGLSKQAALDYGGQLGTLFSALGQTNDAAADSSTQFLGLAADMASFNNVPIDDALTALQAGLRGESEPLRKFGVLLDDATLKARAMEMGLISSTKDALTPQQKALAAQAEILEQTAKQQGDVARTSDGLANSQKKLEANLADVTAEVGGALLPIFTELVRWASANLIPILRKAWETFQRVAAVVGPILKPIIEDLFAALVELWTALEPLFEELLPIGIALFKALAPVIGKIWGILSQGIRIIAQVVRVLTDLVRWLKDAIRFVGDLLNKIPKISIPKISIPFSSSRTAAATGGVSSRAGSSTTATGIAGINLTVVVDPWSGRAAVVRNVREYSRQNGSAQLLPSW
jgi:hypothetical protein